MDKRKELPLCTKVRAPHKVTRVHKDKRDRPCKVCRGSGKVELFYGAVVVDCPRCN